MDRSLSINTGQILTGALFNEPMRVVAVQVNGTNSWTLRLANALSALYPRGSEEKRLLDAMLLAVPR